MFASRCVATSYHRLIQASAIIGFSALVLGCASSGQSDADWPSQPSPSYPAPAGADEPVQEDAPEQTTSSDADDPKEPSTAASTNPLAETHKDKKAQDTLKGKATYYADSLAGNHTASGDVYDPAKFTAAHKKLPFGTILRVTHNGTDKSTYVQVNDRGPFGSADRIIDLSRAAAEELGMMSAGVVDVTVEILEKPEK